mgnify:CR=1 FL=1
MEPSMSISHVVGTFVAMLGTDHCTRPTLKFKVVWHYSGLSLTAERKTDQTVRQSGISTTQVAIISAAVVLVSAMVLAAYIIHMKRMRIFGNGSEMKGKLLNKKCGSELGPSDGQMLWTLFVSTQLLLKHKKELNTFKHETLYPLQRLQSHNFWLFSL